MGLVLTQGLAIGGKEVPIYAYSYALAIDLAAGDANITLTNTDGSDYKVQWGDGEYTTQSSGVAATHTYASDYDGNIIIRSQTPITALSSTDGDWDFDVAVLPDSLVTLDFGFAGVAITGTLVGLPASLSVLDLGGSSSVLDGELEDLPVGLTSIDLNGTASTLTGFLSNFPNTTTYIDLSSTSIELYGDLSDLPASLAYLDLSDTASFITANSAVAMTSARAFYLQDTNMSSDNVDSVLAKLADITTWVTEQAINLGGNNASRTSSSDTDKTTLEGNSVTVTVNEDSPVYGDITYVAAGAQAGGIGDQIAALPAGIAENDHLFIQQVTEYDDTPVAPGGWTQVADTPITTGGTDANTSAALNVYYKQASASESNVTVPDTGGRNLVRMFAFRGADNASLINVQAVANSAGVAEGSHTVSGVTTTIPKGMVLVFVGFGDDGATLSSWTNSNLESITEAEYSSTTSGTDYSMSMAYGRKITAGAIGDTTFATTALDLERASLVLALTPTSSGGVALPTTQATFTINQVAGPANITVTTSDASAYIVNWGDGTISAEVASGAIATHTYASAYDGNVTIHSTGSLTLIDSTAGGWDFPLSSLPTTVTRLDLGGVSNAAITGTLSQLPSGMQYLLLWGTNSAVTGSFGDEPTTLIDMHLFSSSCAISGDINNRASTVLEDITLSETTSDAVFDTANLPATLKVLRLNSSSCTVLATGDAVITSPSRIDIQDLGLSTATVDSVLNALDAVSAWSSPMTLNIGGNNQGYTPATSSAAVATIEALGVTVTANIVPDGGGEIERVGIVAQYTVANGFIDITGGTNFDQIREEIHDAEPMHSRAISCSGGAWKNLSQSDWNIIHANRPSSVPVTGGWFAALWEKDWPLRLGKVRTELKNLCEVQLQPNQTYYIGFNWYLPDTTAARAMVNFDKENTHAFQFHHIDANPTSGLNQRKSRDRFSFGTCPEIDVGPCKFGVWRKCILETNMSTGNDGYVRAWFDPVMVDGVPQGAAQYEYTGRDISPAGGLNMKVGIYYFNNEPLPYDIIHYYNAYFIGNSNSSLGSVYPG